MLHVRNKIFCVSIHVFDVQMKNVHKNRFTAGHCIIFYDYYDGVCAHNKLDSPSIFIPEDRLSIISKMSNFWTNQTVEQFSICVSPSQGQEKALAFFDLL